MPCTATDEPHVYTWPVGICMHELIKLWTISKWWGALCAAKRGQLPGGGRMAALHIAKHT